MQISDILTYVSSKPDRTGEEAYLQDFGALEGGQNQPESISKSRTLFVNGATFCISFRLQHLPVFYNFVNEANFFFFFSPQHPIRVSRTSPLLYIFFLNEVRFCCESCLLNVAQFARLNDGICVCKLIFFFFLQVCSQPASCFELCCCPFFCFTAQMLHRFGKAVPAVTTLPFIVTEIMRRIKSCFRTFHLRRTSVGLFVVLCPRGQCKMQTLYLAYRCTEVILRKDRR